MAFLLNSYCYRLLLVPIHGAHAEPAPSAERPTCV